MIYKLSPKNSRDVKTLIDAKTKKIVANIGDKITKRAARKLEEGGLKHVFIENDELIGQYISNDIINEKNGEVYFEAGAEITEELLSTLAEEKITELSILAIDHTNIGPYMRNTLMADKNTNRDDALVDIYRVMRPGEPPTLETAEALFSALFFDSERYDLSSV